MRLVLRYSTLSTGRARRGSGSSSDHVIGRRQRHHRVKADVVFAAERAGVGQRAAATSVLSSLPPRIRSTNVGSRRSMGVSCIRTTSGSSGPNDSGVGPFVGPRTGNAQVTGQRGADTGHEHPLADRAQKLTTGARSV